MCGRYILGDSTWAAYHAALSIIEPSPKADVSYNIKPTQSVNIAFWDDGALKADLARWWFVPRWHRGDVKEWKATTFNARIETAHEKNTFRGAWKTGRCLIPATSYYEWTGPKGKKQPWVINVAQNNPVFFFAGLYSELHDGSKTCSIVTREADPQITELHPRMPVILSGDQMMPWITSEATDAQVWDSFGTGWDFNFHRVAPFGIKDDGPELIDRGDLF